MPWASADKIPALLWENTKRSKTIPETVYVLSSQQGFRDCFLHKQRIFLCTIYILGGIL